MNKRSFIFYCMLIIMSTSIFGIFQTTPINLSDTGEERNCVTPKMAVDRWGGVHIVWSEFIDGTENAEIFYVRYGPNGWTEKVNISENSWPSVDPDVATDEDGNVYFVWSDTQNRPDYRFGLLFREMDPNGNLSNSRTLISDAGTDLQLPSIAVNPEQDISVVTYGHNYRVFGINRENGEWKPWGIINRPTARFAGESASCVWGGDGRFHAVWPSYGSGDPAMTIYYTSRQTGQSWDTPVQVNSTGQAQAHPKIFVEENGTRHVTWMDEEEEAFFEIVYERYNPSTGTWELPYIISQETDLCNLPTITKTTDDLVYIAWTFGAWGRLKNAFYSYKDSSDKWIRNQPFTENDIANPYFTEIASGGPNHNVFFVYEQSTKVNGHKDIKFVSKYPIELKPMIFPPENLSFQQISTAKLNRHLNNFYNLVTWDPNPSNEEITVSSYYLYRRGKNESDEDFVRIAVLDPDIHSYSDTDILRGQEYVYGISAVDEEGSESGMLTTED